MKLNAQGYLSYAQPITYIAKAEPQISYIAKAEPQISYASPISYGKMISVEPEGKSWASGYETSWSGPSIESSYGKSYY